MKSFISLLCAILLILLVPFKSLSQETQIYKHPIVKFQFEASKNWIYVSHPEDSLIYEMIRPDSNIHVVLWYTETEQDAKDYLLKMASMKDLMITNEVPSKKSFNNRDMWMLNVPGYVEKMPVRMILGITARGKSTKHPKENCLYIIQIWCARDKYKFEETHFMNILQSVKIDM